MNKLTDICFCITVITLSVCMVFFTHWITGEDESSANAPACVITGDGRGQKK